VGLAVVVDLVVDEVRVELDLVDRGGHVAGRREALEVRDLEVRDADRAGAPSRRNSSSVCHVETKSPP
jgi:hypothetical protein